MSTDMSARRVLVPAAIVAVMGFVAALGFRGVFPDWAFASAAAIGALGAAAAMWVARWAKLRVAEAFALSMIAFVFLGAIAAEGIPTPAAFSTFFDGLITGWSRLLSSTPPADLTSEFRVLPYTVAWSGSMVGMEILRSSKVPGLAALGPVAAMALSLLVTLEDRTVALTQGAFMVAGTVLLGWAQQRLAPRSEHHHEDTSPGAGRRIGLIGSVAAVSFVGLFSPLLGPRMPLADANDRFNLRDYQVPPFDPLREPSPLVQVKASLREATKDDVVFVVRSPERVTRFPLAIHGDYDGVVWSVADRAGNPAAEFRPVDSRFPLPTGGTVESWRTTNVQFEIKGLQVGEFDPVWMPTAGWPISIQSNTPLDIRFNSETGTVAIPPVGAASGLTYDMVVALPPSFSDEAVRAATISVTAGDASLPPQIRGFADDVLEGADKGWAQVEAIRGRFVEQGFYDARELQTTARPGHSLYRLSEFFSDPEYLVGFEEQYAAAAALIAQGAGVPARVVVGYQIPAEKVDERWATGTLEVKTSDMSAWIEVNVDGIGWVPVDVTPPRDRAPEERNTGVSEREVAVPNPPPPPPPPEPPARFEEEEEFDEEVTEEENTDDEDVEAGGIPIAAIATAAAVASPLVLFVGLATLVLVAKRRRSRRRRLQGSPSRRVAGAWYEFVDRCRELGAAPPRASTPKEFARGLIDADLVDAEQREHMLVLAGHVDEAAYHPSPASDLMAEDAWARTDQVIATITARQSSLQRLRSRLDPRPLLRRDPLAVDKENSDG